MVTTRQATAAEQIASFHQWAINYMETHGESTQVRAEIGRRLKELSLRPDILPEAQLERLHTAGSMAKILHEGPEGRGALMLLFLPAEAPTPIHNHNSWGIAAVVSGVNRYWRWERTDDLSDPNQAELRLLEEFEHGPGETVEWPEPPQDLHAQQGVGGPAIEFVFFGRNPNREPRAYFDPMTGAVTYANAMG